MIRNTLKILNICARPRYGFFFNNQQMFRIIQRNKQIQVKNDNDLMPKFDLIVQDKKDHNPISYEMVLHKMQIAEMMMGTDLEIKNKELYDELFHQDLMKRVVFYQSFEDKYMNLIRLKYRLLSLEFEYRIKNKDFDRSRKVLEQYKQVSQIQNDFENSNDENEKQLREYVRLATYHDMKALIEQRTNNDQFIFEIEESIRYREKSIQILDELIANSNDFEKVKNNVTKNAIVNKIGQSFDILGNILMNQEEYEQARPYFQKALEIFGYSQGQYSWSYIICKVKYARSYRNTDVQKAIELLMEIYNLAEELNIVKLKITVGMQLFAFKSYIQVFDQQLYQEIINFYEIQKIDDHYIFAEFLSAAIRYTSDKNPKLMEQHIEDIIKYLNENIIPPQKLEKELKLVSKYCLKLPDDSQRRQNLLKILAEKIEQFVQTHPELEKPIDLVYWKALIEYDFGKENTQNAVDALIKTLFKIQYKDDIPNYIYRAYNHINEKKVDGLHKAFINSLIKHNTLPDQLNKINLLLDKHK